MPTPLRVSFAPSNHPLDYHRGLLRSSWRIWIRWRNVRMTVKQLRRSYLFYNRKYFGGKLPKNTECGFFESPPADARGEVYCRSPEELSKGQPHAIWINRHYCRDANSILLILLHEMIHLHLMTKHDSRQGHGPKFQREQLRLVKAGALNDLW